MVKAVKEKSCEWCALGLLTVNFLGSSTAESRHFGWLIITSQHRRNAHFLAAQTQQKTKTRETRKSWLLNTVWVCVCVWILLAVNALRNYGRPLCWLGGGQGYRCHNRTPSAAIVTQAYILTPLSIVNALKLLPLWPPSPHSFTTLYSSIVFFFLI